MQKIPQHSSGASHSRRSKTPESPPPTETWNFIKTFRYLLPYLQPYRKPFFWGSLCLVATNLVGVLGPWILKFAIEDLQLAITAQKIFLYATLIVAIALVAGVFRYLMRKIIISISRYIEFDLRTEYFGHLQKLTPSFYDHQQTGDLMTRATSDVEAVRMVIGPAVMYFMDTIFTTAFALILMLAISIPLTLYVLALAPFVSLLIYFLAKKIHTHSLHSQERYSELNAMIQEHLTGLRVVRSYCQEEPERRLFQGLNQRYMEASLVLVRLQALLIPFFYSLFGVGLALVLYVGGRAIITGTMTLGDFVAFSAYVAMLAWPVMAAGWVINLYQRGSASLQRIHKILKIQPDIIQPPTPTLPDKLKGQISFKNVSFTYPQTLNPVLKNLNLDIPVGSSLGIVGPVGAGKTSLISLILHLYDLSAGELRLDGYDIKEIPITTLRRDISVVPQESFLFSDRLDKNILFADTVHADGQLQQVARLAQLQPEVETFPQGYETWVGERGLTLSGGQKQRASLARALAAEPQILILDDCFSAVDTHTEAEITRELRPFLEGKTLILIAHRLSTLQWADQIIVLQEGRISETGTHQELLERGGWYAAMYQQQLLEEKLEEKQSF